MACHSCWCTLYAGANEHTPLPNARYTNIRSAMGSCLQLRYFKCALRLLYASNTEYLRLQRCSIAFGYVTGSLRH